MAETHDMRINKTTLITNLTLFFRSAGQIFFFIDCSESKVIKLGVEFSFSNLFNELIFDRGKYLNYYPLCQDFFPPPLIGD